MPTVTRVLVKEKTGFSPADKKQRGDTQGCDQVGHGSGPVD